MAKLVIDGQNLDCHLEELYNNTVLDLIFITIKKLNPK